MTDAIFKSPDPARKPRVALVVAHPDDETLWCGGLVARFRKSVDWTIICCSIPRRDPIRAEKFHDACERLGASSLLLHQIESEPTDFLPVPPIDLSGYDSILTHGAAGEYGHRHHVDVHNQIKERIPATKLMFIGTRIGGAGTLKIDLTDDEEYLKLHALEAYDHISPTDKGVPKWQALLLRYGDDFDIGEESYDFA